MKYGVWERLTAWTKAFNKTHEGKDRPLGFGGWICMILRLAGAALTIASFGILLLPALAGWSWLAAGVYFCVAQLFARTLIQFYWVWLEVEAVFYQLYAYIMHGVSWREYASRP